MSGKGATERRRAAIGGGHGRRRRLDRLYRIYDGICQTCNTPVSRKDASAEHLLPVREYPELARDTTYQTLVHKECNI